jgi:uroporphyrin-III C-methyltransferase
MRRSQGHVYIVGAGPGDPELITVKGLNLLRKADVVIYDRLVPSSLIRRIPHSTEKIYVGKGAGWHTIGQKEIDKITIEYAKRHKVVIRLKGGDPFLFGRGGEEAQELKKAGIRFTVVPGVTSAIAVPAYAGIPVTHRKYASSIAIVTGHQDPDKRQHVNWKKLATAVDAVIILMGTGRLREIMRELLKGGCERNTKVAIVEWGTTRRQRTVTGTLSDIVKKAISRKLKPPTIIIVGEVVKLRRSLAWFRPGT